jgi:predicted metalloprotease with PDZ domain
MNRNLLLAFVAILPFFNWAFNPVQNDRSYQTHLDLTHIVDGRIMATVVVPILEQDSVIYNMPKIVPGTYKVYDFGRFVHELKAYNSKGEELPVKKRNTNQWQIGRAGDLYNIQYWVSDSYSKKRSRIFAPAGTGIAEDAFMLNNFGFLGYLEGFKDYPFTLTVKRNPGFYGTTSLGLTASTDSTDTYSASNYFELHDCPILYAEPDTASFRVAGIPVRFGVYSPEGNISATRIREAVKPVFEAAATYLGGVLPAEQYVVIVYGLPIQKAMYGTGALEHHTSTVLNMPDVEENMLALFSGGDPMQIYRDIVAHEFFHIVTPLNIHAKQIHDYDFINPQMSEHLWLYEGVTEYNAMISQARAGIIDLEEFIEEVKFKMAGARDFDQDVPFTQMSRYALSFYSNQYLNVYQQGALIGLSVDLKLRTLSEGEYGLINLLQDLWQTYGQDTFFVDNELFEIMAETSGYPELEAFLVRHIAGTKPLPLSELFAGVGIDYQPEVREMNIAMGGLKMLAAQDNAGMVVTAIDEDHPMIKELGLKKYDIITQWNGKKVTGKNGRLVLKNWSETAQAGEAFTVEIKRETKKDKFKNVELRSHAVTEETIETDVFAIDESLTNKQRALRALWINQ